MPTSPGSLATISPPIDGLRLLTNPLISVGSLFSEHAYIRRLAYNLKGETDVLQIRPQDQINLLGLRAKAEAAIEQGITDPVMKFRGEQNFTRYLTPDETYALTNDALAHIESIYDYSWELKGAIDAALKAEDREGIETAEW